VISYNLNLHINVSTLQTAVTRGELAITVTVSCSHNDAVM